MTTRSVRVFPDVIKREVATSRSTRQALQPIAVKATRIAQQVARERVNRQTGRYERSFKSRIDAGRGSNEVARIVIENTAPYAKYIEAGTRPHVMRAKAGVYVFDTDAGDTVFTHGPIDHPGTTAQRVLEVAVKRLASGRMF